MEMTQLWHLFPFPLPPNLLHGICVYSREASTLKVLALGYVILISLECCLPATFSTLGSCGSRLPPTRNANSFLGTDSL